MDIRGQLEALTSKMSGRVRNVTCVMQELGYLDENLEPNFAKISEKISNLPVSEELRRDLQDSVTFCQQFSVSYQIYKKQIFVNTNFSQSNFYVKSKSKILKKRSNVLKKVK